MVQAAQVGARKVRVVRIRDMRCLWGQHEHCSHITPISKQTVFVCHCPCHSTKQLTLPMAPTALEATR